MPFLSCESRASTLASIADILAVSCSRVETFIGGLDPYEPDYSFRDHSYELSPLVDALLRCTGSSGLRWDGTDFFHFTRMKDLQDLRNGLRPLHDVAGKLQTLIQEVGADVLGGAPWAAFWNDFDNGVSGCVWASNYREKLELGRSVHGGPQGWLVLERGDPKYLCRPELVEEVERALTEAGQDGQEFREAFRSKTVPAIVRMRIAGERSPRYLDGAISYLHWINFKNQEGASQWGATPCHLDREGVGVEFENLCLVPFSRWPNEHRSAAGAAPTYPAGFECVGKPG